MEKIGLYPLDRVLLSIKHGKTTSPLRSGVFVMFKWLGCYTFIKTNFPYLSLPASSGCCWTAWMDCLGGLSTLWVYGLYILVKFEEKYVQHLIRSFLKVKIISDYRFLPNFRVIPFIFILFMDFLPFAFSHLICLTM